MATEMQDAELKVLALAKFVENDFKADLIRKADVVTLLKWAARATRQDYAGIPEAWVDETLKDYGIQDSEVPKCQKMTLKLL